MLYRKLGRSGLDVGVVGLGAEYLEHASRETVLAVVDEAVAGGVNYIDLFMPSPDVRDNLGIALKGRRDRVMVAGHLGATLENGQYSKSRDPNPCEAFFDDLLTRLQTDYIDVLMLHFIDEPEDYDRVFSRGGLLELAQRLEKEGKARLIGMSSHRVPVALKAVRSGCIDVLMFPVNPAADILPGDTEMETMFDASKYEQATGRESAAPSRHELYRACASQGAGIAAMKPYYAGWLFNPENNSGIVLTPVQCLSYALSQPGVCTVVPGCKTPEEMKAALAYVDAAAKERDFSTIDVNAAWKLRGTCTYCNHCLPCPVSIDIATVTRLADTAGYGRDDRTTAEYLGLPVTASACTECGVCSDRCPFGVDVIANMKRAEELFGRWLFMRPDRGRT